LKRLQVTDHIPPHDRFYNDGPDFPTTPLLQQAEQAYREAFLAAVREAVCWGSFSERILQAAWKERRRVRERAEIWVPSALLFGDPWMDSEQIVYQKGHEIAACRARGRVQGLEAIQQTYHQLFEKHYVEVTIRDRVIKPWLQQRIEPWSVTLIDPAEIDAPHWPLEWMQRYKDEFDIGAPKRVANQPELST